ncbi:hypothetical protein GSI_02892 [Ganoderma sinense ZZ0214-1]|uniref:DUF6535 domain-containing protein n=1 Tax=Ganoderma sinense ZZ0214-1 TaxID=1077348 RepID=A0A2G8SMV9_9APHY|nr:hypothetical protein GSI_02892 [Ganoderma sinense ZZ0214-1]
MEARANTDARVSPEEWRSLADTTDSGTSDSKNHVSWVTSGVITQEDKDEAYEKTAKIVETYSDETIKKWNDEIDNLLVFAALYSGILTAFNVQSYPYLQPPTPDTTLAILQQISLQLNSFTTSPPFTNSTHVTPIATTVQVPQLPLWVVTLNVLWFWALIISLSVAYFALMVQQWLREYQNRCSGTSREYARLRQHRLNNLIAWHVSWIVGILPVLLQASLSLFFAGLLVLLWHFHSTVTIFASALVGIVMFIVLLLTILPVLRSDCSYVSPPGIPLLYAKQSIMFVVNAASVWLFSLVVFGAPLLPRCVNITDAQLSVLNDWWIKWQHNISHAHIFTTRHGEELAITHKSSSKLDVDTIIFGYHATMSLDHVSTLVPILIDQTPDEVDRCLTSICELRNRHHSILERARDISIELRKPFKHGWSSYLGESFRLLDL